MGVNLDSPEEVRISLSCTCQFKNFSKTFCSGFNFLVVKCSTHYNPIPFIHFDLYVANERASVTRNGKLNFINYYVLNASDKSTEVTFGLGEGRREMALSLALDERTRVIPCDGEN